MAVARHGTGPTAVGRALASQVHPVFMLPPLATAVFGAILAESIRLPAAGFHVAAIFCAVYTAHVKDGYIDFHHRGEDDDHPLTIVGCRLALVGATGGFLVCVTGLLLVSGPIAAVVTVPTWVIGYFHAPQLDSTTIGATFGYPVGVLLAFLGGFVVQTGGVTILPLAIGTVLVVLLAGVKIVDDTTDFGYDRRFGKPTVAVVFGPGRARWLANGLFGGVVLLVVVFTVVGVLPPSSIGAAIAFTIVVFLAKPTPPKQATMLLVRGAYVFLAVLVAAIWFHPLS